MFREIEHLAGGPPDALVAGMGKRPPPKKLAVKTETLRKLAAQDLRQVAGGRPPTQTFTCAMQ